MLNGKSILVTGGTGSFGHQFVSYVLDHYDPEKICRMNINHIPNLEN